MNPFDQLWDEEYLRKEVEEYFGEFDESRWNLDAGISEASKFDDYNLFTKGYVYQATWNCARNAEKDKYTAIRDLALDRKCKIALDFGCGIGSGVITLGLQGIKTIGAEINVHCLGLLRRRAERFGLSSIVDVVDLYLTPICETFDFIVCTEVFEHLEDPQGHAEGLIQMLEPGGVAVLSWSFVPMPGHLPQYFHLQAPHPDDLLTMGFGKFIQELGMEFKGYSWFNNMIWEKPL